jgi:endonuclease III
MKPQMINEFFARLAQENPVPETELYYTNAFTLLVAVMMSAQATDKSVNKVTKTLFQIADTPEKMLNLEEDKIRQHIRTIGFFNTKAKNIIKLSQILVENYQGQVPDNRQDLESFPGVGRKTANVVLNVFFEHPTIAVDTHIFRVANRTGLAAGKTPYEIEMKLLKCIPEARLLHAHHWLILHGRYICKARKPECARCPVYDLCAYEAKTA